MSRRLAAAATILFLALQFVLLGSGFTCIPPSNGGSGMAEMAEMAEMDMVGELGFPVAAQAMDGEQDPCHAPWMPVDCHAMAPCAATAVAAPAVSILFAPSCAHETERLIVLTPPSRTTPPDLPPPRA